jgi:hypothetical protein
LNLIYEEVRSLGVFKESKPWLRTTWKRKSKLFVATMVVSSLQRPSITIARL